MLKMLLAVGLLIMLSACEHTQTWAQHFAFMRTHTDSTGQFDFNWQLSGAHEVAPLQVFSSEDQLWLQFAVGQNIPAIFAIENNRQIPLSYKRSDPYIVIKGTWKELVFRGAALQAKAQYQAPILAEALTVSIEKELELAVPSAIDRHSLTSEPALVPQAKPVKKAVSAPINSNGTATDITHFSLGELPFSVEPNDGTMRHVLKRWALREGWFFHDQYWEVEVDLPIISAASFSSDFTDSVTQLMRSTALGVRPLQACLYSNKVIRVIPLAQNCDPTSSTSSLYQG